LADPAALTPAVRRIVNELDPSVPLANIRTMESVVHASMARVSFIMTLLAVAATMAVVLSAVGLYAVISYVVTQRRSEIGVRMALGAQVGQVSRLVMRESLQLAGLGVLLGVSASLAVNRVLSTLLFGVGPNDPVTLAGVSALLIGIALLATILPARRAARVDPVAILRDA
jgi:ABC-type antimicrobial peptide transport system permease subunit